jgi:hypothetical protein
MGKSAKFAKKPSKRERESTKIIKNTQNHASSFPTIAKPLVKPKKVDPMDMDPVHKPADKPEKATDKPTDKHTDKPTDTKLSKKAKKLGIKSTGKIKKTETQAKEKRKTLLQQLTKEEFEEPKRLFDGRPDYVDMFEGKSKARQLKKDKLVKKLKK